MKRVMAYTMLALTLTVLLMSCGASQGGHCDAYGSLDDTGDHEKKELAVR